MEVPVKWAKGGEDERKFSFNEAKDDKERTTPVNESAFVDSS